MGRPGESEVEHGRRVVGDENVRRAVELADVGISGDVAEGPGGAREPAARRRRPGRRCSRPAPARARGCAPGRDRRSPSSGPGSGRPRPSHPWRSWSSCRWSRRRRRRSPGCRASASARKPGTAAGRPTRCEWGRRHSPAASSPSSRSRVHGAREHNSNAQAGRRRSRPEASIRSHTRAALCPSSSPPNRVRNAP
jgi:hypothetical protein